MTDTERKRIEAICEVAGVKEIDDLSDGFHTFQQLYYQRMMLFAVIVKQNKNKAWKSLRHEDGELCFGGGWFIVGIDTPEGSYTYHYENKYFDLFDCEILDYGKHWDGHTEKDVTRLLSLESSCSEIPNSSDCIDRAEAQTAIQFAARRYTVAHEAHGEGHVVWSDNLISVTDAMNALREVSPAQPSLVKESRNIVKDLVEDDTISRKAAIDAIFSEPLYKSGMKKRDVDAVVPAIYEKIKSLPSAQPETHKKHTETHACDTISRQDAIDVAIKADIENNDGVLSEKRARNIDKHISALPPAQPERLTDDDFETIRIHLNAYKEKLCNQQRWEEANEYQRIIDRFMAFASAQPEPIRINLNEPIKVKLTDWGKEIYYHQYDRINQIVGREACKPSFPKEDENGYTEFQLWCFMELYGECMGMTLPNVIEPLEIVYER